MPKQQPQPSDEQPAKPARARKRTTTAAPQPTDAKPSAAPTTDSKTSAVIGKIGPAKSPRRTATFRILLVDAQSATGDVVARCMAKDDVAIATVSTLAEARKQLAREPADLVMVDSDLPDGTGLTLARELKKSRPDTQTIIVSTESSFTGAVEAMRQGASDYLVKPLNAREVSDRLHRAIERQQKSRRTRDRVRRLKRICHKLNRAREEVTQQVDILCNDLVTAYQELANQMQHVVQTSEFAAVIKNELDLEQLIRRTLEFTLDKAGPTNAAIFLPASNTEYHIGGYINYDCSSQSPEMLLQHLADVAAPKVSNIDAPLHITDNDTLAKWIGDDYAYLADCHVLAMACKHEGETLAVIVLFRDQTQPFTPLIVETCAAVGPTLAEHLTRLIRIHHRGSLENDAEAA